eukprot:7588425-Lingulodinium_polyedra.AAC.1
MPGAPPAQLRALGSWARACPRAAACRLLTWMFSLSRDACRTHADPAARCTCDAEPHHFPAPAP